MTNPTKNPQFDSLHTDELGNTIVVNSGDDAETKLNNLTTGDTIIFTSPETYTVSGVTLPESVTLILGGATLERDDTNPVFTWGRYNLVIGGLISGANNGGYLVEDPIEAGTGREATFINTRFTNYIDGVRCQGTAVPSFRDCRFTPGNVASGSVGLELAASDYPDNVRRATIDSLFANADVAIDVTEGVEQSRFFGSVQPSCNIGVRVNGEISATEFGGSVVPDGPSFYLDTNADVSNIDLKCRVNGVTQGINGLAEPTGAIHVEETISGERTIDITSGDWDVSTGPTFSDQSTSPYQMTFNITGGQAADNATFEGGRVDYPNNGAQWTGTDLSNAIDLTTREVQEGVTEVSTTETTILSNLRDQAFKSNFWGGVVVVVGSEQGDNSRFTDLVLHSDKGAATVVNSIDFATPDDRSYGVDLGDLTLTMSANTYDVTASIVGSSDQPPN